MISAGQNKNSFTFFAIFYIIFLYWPLSTVLAAHFSIERTVTENVHPWEKIECLRDSRPFFPFEKFHPKSRQNHSILKQAFGTPEPSSRFVLLHYAPGWQGKTDNPADGPEYRNKSHHSENQSGKHMKASQAPPVLLVHGAGDHAYHAWCHPYAMEVTGDEPIDRPGLMQYLSSRGFRVFAVTFSHPHGDNFYQAEQLANAIARIKEVTGGGDDFKVDIVCHSKGAMPVRIYVSDIAGYFPKYKWLTPYRGDVRKVVFIASPLKGIDTAFRYLAYNIAVLQKNIAAPLGVTSLALGALAISDEHYNEMFPGQWQMLHDFVSDGVPFNWQSSTGDFNYSRDVLYYGGSSAFLSSPGLEKAKKEAGNIIDVLNSRGLSPDITAYILAGTKWQIDSLNVGFLQIPVGEQADISDGVLFLRSATFTEGLTVRGAKIGGICTLNTHHVGLVVLPAAMEFVEHSLK